MARYYTDEQKRFFFVLHRRFNGKLPQASAEGLFSKSTIKSLVKRGAIILKDGYYQAKAN